MHARADQQAVTGYDDRVLAERILASGRVELFAGCDHVGGRRFVSREAGEVFEVPERCRVVAARYLSPDIPAESPPRFGVEDDVRVIPVNEATRGDDAVKNALPRRRSRTATPGSTGPG